MSREPFATYAEMDAAFVAYLKYADRWTAPKSEPVPVNPGDFATRRQESAEAILARNVACTPVAWWHPTSHGETL